MKTSDSMAWECKLFTYEFLGFQDTDNMFMKGQSNTTCIASQTSTNSKNNPHTNMIQNSFKMESKFMKTSDLMAWECKIFTYEFLGFRVKNNIEIKLNKHT